MCVRPRKGQSFRGKNIHSLSSKVLIAEVQKSLYKSRLRVHEHTPPMEVENNIFYLHAPPQFTAAVR